MRESLSLPATRACGDRGLGVGRCRRAGHCPVAGSTMREPPSRPSKLGAGAARGWFSDFHVWITPCSDCPHHRPLLHIFQAHPPAHLHADEVALGGLVPGVRHRLPRGQVVHVAAERRAGQGGGTMYVTR